MESWRAWKPQSARVSRGLAAASWAGAAEVLAMKKLAAARMVVRDNCMIAIEGRVFVEEEIEKNVEGGLLCRVGLLSG